MRLVGIVLLIEICRAALIDWELAGAVPDDKTAAPNNTQLLNQLFDTIQPGDTLFIANKSFWVAGGVRAVRLVCRMQLG